MPPWRVATFCHGCHDQRRRAAEGSTMAAPRFVCRWPAYAAAPPALPPKTASKLARVLGMLGQLPPDPSDLEMGEAVADVIRSLDEQSASFVSNIVVPSATDIERGCQPLRAHRSRREAAVNGCLNPAPDAAPFCKDDDSARYIF